MCCATSVISVWKHSCSKVESVISLCLADSISMFPPQHTSENSFFAFHICHGHPVLSAVTQPCVSSCRPTTCCQLSERTKHRTPGTSTDCQRLVLLSGERKLLCIFSTHQSLLSCIISMLQVFLRGWKCILTASWKRRTMCHVGLYHLSKYNS